MKKGRKVVHGPEFYKRVLKIWYSEKRSSVMTAKDIYSIFERVDAEMSILKEGEEKDYHYYRYLLEKVLEILGDQIEKERIGVSMSYSLKIKDYETLKEVIERFENCIKESKQPSNETKKQAATSSVGNISSMREPTLLASMKKSVIEEVWKILSWMYKNGKEMIDQPEIKDVIGKRFDDKVLISWKKVLESYGVQINVRYIGKLEILSIRGIQEAFTAIKSVAKDNFDLDLKIPERKERQEEEKKVDMSIDENTCRMYYAIGGLIMKNGSNKSLELDVVCKYLRENFGINQTKEGIMKSLSGTQEIICLYSQSSKLKLRNGNESWEIIKKKYGPMNFPKWVDARLTLSQQILTEYFPEVKMLSKISENDAIYRITYYDTKHSMSKWTALYRKFRDTDAIFDENLSERIESEISRMDELFGKDDIAFEIEGY